MLQPHNICYHLAGENDEDKLYDLYHVCRDLKPPEVQIWMIDSESSVARLRKIQDIFGLGKGHELVKEGNLCLLRIALADELEGEVDIRMASKCFTISAGPRGRPPCAIAEGLSQKRAQAQVCIIYVQYG